MDYPMPDGMDDNTGDANPQHVKDGINSSLAAPSKYEKIELFMPLMTVINAFFLWYLN